MGAVAAISLILAAVAGTMHVAIFAAESVLWTRPRVWRRFGVASQAAAEELEFFAFNQGFYNLFLACGAIIGPILVVLGYSAVGWSAAVYATASMLCAAVVLRVGGGQLYTRAAATQGTVPMLSLIGAAVFAAAH